MNRVRRISNLLILSGIAFLALSLTWAALGSADSMMKGKNDFSPLVNATGEISLPDDFRRSLVHLGSWFVPEGGASGFHDVYADDAAVDGYRQTGRFPDGSVLIKELRAHKAGTYTTGAGVAHATDAIKQWFVMVKDSENRFADRAEWGEGWGWALFKTDSAGKNVVTDYKADCLGCHVPAKANDWIYTEGYPTLRRP